MKKINDTAKNTLFFAVATFGSKSISFALLPLYSYKLKISEFGELDLILTLLMLSMPLITLSLYEAIQKNLTINDGDEKTIVSSVIIPFIIWFVLVSILVFFVNELFFKNNRVYLFLMVLFSSSIFEFLARHSKGNSRIFVFASASMLFALSLLLFNFIFLYFLDFNLDGVLISYFLSYNISSLYFILTNRVYKLVRLKHVDRKIIEKMTSLSVPLMFNAMLWWVFDISDRWILLFFMDKETVGVYSMACKISGLLIIVHSILFQTWQVFAMKNFNEPNRDALYSSFSKNYILIIFSSAITLISFSRYIFEFILSDAYIESQGVGNFLVIGGALFAISSFLGVFYVVTNKTKKALFTSLSSALINVVMNIMLIPFFGLYGAVIATISSNFILLVLRMKDVSKICPLGIFTFHSLILILMILFQFYILYFLSDIYIFSFLAFSYFYSFYVWRKG